MPRTTARPSVPREGATAARLLRDAQKRGDAEMVGILTWLLDGRQERQRDSRQERRLRLYGSAGTELLEALDRRREAARRMPPICDRPHARSHARTCYDPDVAA